MTDAKATLSSMFSSMADLLALQRANPHRVRAYKRAAESLANLDEPIEVIAGRGALEEIPGIGRELSAKIQEFLDTGTMRSYDALLVPLPPEVADWATIPGLPPPIVHHLYFRLGIGSLTDLEALVRSHMLQTLPGVTASDDRILAAIRDRLEAEPPPGRGPEK